MARPPCPFHRCRRMDAQRGVLGRPSPDHGRSRSGLNPTPGPCCEDATRATPWAATPERRQRRISPWCFRQRWGWAALCWTWTRRARNETAPCRSAALRVPRGGPPSLSWRKSSSRRSRVLWTKFIHTTQSFPEHMGRMFGLELLEGLEPSCL